MHEINSGKVLDYIKMSKKELELELVVFNAQQVMLVKGN
jgi:hypothetical protein